MTCSFPLCTQAAVKNNYCFQHNRVYGNVKADKKKEPISKKSEKAKEDDKEYNKWKKEFLSRPENKVCNIQVENVCTIKATTVNHLKRRFKNTKMNEQFVEPACAACNVYIENHDAWARENGHLLSKFN